jgi:flagellin
MIGGVNFASSQIASVYNTGSQQLANTLTKIASGKKFQNASEDMTGFLRAQNLKVDISGYEKVRQDLTSIKTYTAAAVQSSSSIYESLTEMKDLANQYADTDVADTDQLAEIEAEFDSLKRQVSKALSSTYVDGDLVTTSGSIKETNLDPDGNSTLDVNFAVTVSTPVTITALDVTAGTAVADVQDELDNMLIYMSEAQSYDAIADQQLKLTDTIVNSKQAVMSLITDIDDAREMNNVLDLTLRQQAGVAMMAQANMVKNSLSKLYE